MQFPSPTILFLACALVSGVCGNCASLAAEDAEGLAFFERKIRPVLVEHCHACHSSQAAEGKKIKGGLTLDGRVAMLRGGDSGPVLVPGEPEKSLIIRAMRYEDIDMEMPPKRKLPAQVVADFEAWIKMGAPAPQGEAGLRQQQPVIDLDKAREHWAFRPFAATAAPAVKNQSWPRSPIDSFILAKLEAAGLTPSAPADRGTLIRRAYFDLIGLPPSPQEVRDFVADDSPDAYEDLIDRLLASPHYGERWGRHWLDLARYADSSGFHDDLDRPDAWRYRDYVIRSFNEDKPYAQFVREQLAGDEVDPENLEAWIATGFNRNGPSNDNNIAPGFKEEYRLDQLDDVISTASTVFLGVTIGCARCHDHKTDPFTQRDYYQLLAVFNTSVNREQSLTDDGSAFRPPVDKNDKAAVEAAKKKKGKIPAIRAFTDSSAKPRATRVLLRGNLKTPGEVVSADAPQVLAHLVATPLNSGIKPSEKTTGQRAALAQWITARDNALAWRVIANRLWQYHFGRGLVATSDNLGLSGEKATHPELLDWLAQQMIAQGGRFKPMHKMIMMSQTYQQASTHSSLHAGRDPRNELLWRMNKRRLEAEIMRDSVLEISGNLNRQMHGPGIKPRLPADMIDNSQRNKWPAIKEEGPAHWRRSVYIYIKRQLLMPMLELFDAPTSSVSCARRTTSTIPTQALTMLNGQFMNDQAAHFAKRVINIAGENADDQVKHALWLALSREPDGKWIADDVQFLAQQRKMHIDAGAAQADAHRLALTDYAIVLMNSSQFLYVD